MIKEHVFGGYTQEDTNIARQLITCRPPAAGQDTGFRLLSPLLQP